MKGRTGSAPIGLLKGVGMQSKERDGIPGLVWSYLHVNGGMVIGDAPLEDIRGNRRLESPDSRWTRIRARETANQASLERQRSHVPPWPLFLRVCVNMCVRACTRWIRGNPQKPIPLERNYGITCSCDPSVIRLDTLTPRSVPHVRQNRSQVSVRYIYYIQTILIWMRQRDW